MQKTRAAKTVRCIKANQVLTKEKTRVPGGIIYGQGREGNAATAPALLLALFYGYYTFNSCLDESVVDDDVLLIAHELGSSWKMVGRALKVPDHEIDRIEANESEVSEKGYCKCNCVVCIVINT